MNSGLNRFLGDTPARTAVKLIVISFIVGMVLSALNLSVYDVLYKIRDFLLRIWNMGFDAIEQFAEYFVIGAILVIPVYLLIRVLKYRR